MADKIADVATMQQVYKAAVDAWVETIRAEEALVAETDTLAEVDRWEAAHFREEEFRNAAKKVKSNLEAAIRKEFFGF